MNKTNPIKRVTQGLFVVVSLMCLTGCYVNPRPELVAADPQSDMMLASLGTTYFMGTRKRESALPAVERVKNHEVNQHLSKFVKKGRKTILESYLRRKKYERVLRAVFQEQGVPEEMLALALVESTYKPDVRSHAGAMGMWQFMKATARAYGLKISGSVDQRKDPVLATIAAAHHLRDLYTEFRDWPLAMAAYNAGSGRVQKAIRRGGTTDFWALSRKKLLPAETRNYVPKILAVMHIHDNPKQYGFPEIAAYKQNFKSLS